MFQHCIWTCTETWSIIPNRGACKVQINKISSIHLHALNLQLVQIYAIPYKDHTVDIQPLQIRPLCCVRNIEHPPSHGTRAGP